MLNWLTGSRLRVRRALSQALFSLTATGGKTKNDWSRIDWETIEKSPEYQRRQSVTRFFDEELIPKLEGPEQLTKDGLDELVLESGYSLMEVGEVGVRRYWVAQWRQHGSPQPLRKRAQDTAAIKAWELLTEALQVPQATLDAIDESWQRAVGEQHPEDQCLGQRYSWDSQRSGEG